MSWHEDTFIIVWTSLNTDVCAYYILTFSRILTLCVVLVCVASELEGTRFFTETSKGNNENKFFPRNVAADWLALLLHIRESSASNLGPKISFLDWGLSSHFSVLPAKYQVVFKLSYVRLLPYTFKFIIYQSSYHSTPCILSSWQPRYINHK